MFPDGNSVTASMSTPRAHSRELLPMLQGLLEKQGLTWQEIGAFAVGVGPGSFTGLRVACATIAGINASLKKPVYALSSLAITGRQAKSDIALWAIEDARSGFVYAGRFQQGETLQSPACIAWGDFLQHQPAPYISVGTIPNALAGWQVMPVKLSREQALVEAVKHIKPDDRHGFWVGPLYLQPSQAERNFV